MRFIPKGLAVCHEQMGCYWASDGSPSRGQCDERRMWRESALSLSLSGLLPSAPSPLNCCLPKQSTAAHLCPSSLINLAIQMQANRSPVHQLPPSRSVAVVGHMRTNTRHATLTPKRQHQREESVNHVHLPHHSTTTKRCKVRKAEKA